MGAAKFQTRIPRIGEHTNQMANDAVGAGRFFVIVVRSGFV
jgi:hypothetical protein